MYQHLRIVRPFKIYPNRDFWFENMPSGNPGMIRCATFAYSLSVSETQLKTFFHTFRINLHMKSGDETRQVWHGKKRLYPGIKFRTW
jgi:hypothetical protein